MTQAHAPSLSPALEHIEGDILDNLDSWWRHLAPPGTSPKTRETYTESASQFAKFLAAHNMPTNVAHIKREHIEAFIEDLAARWKSSTVSNRYRGLQQFFGWLVAEGELRESPMARMRPPKVEEVPPPVLRIEQIQAVIGACEKGRTFEDRRDAAIIRLLLDTGCRRSELAGIRVQDIDIDRGLLYVTGKASKAHGPRTRQLTFGNNTTKALDRWLRVRKNHPKAKTVDAFFLGHKGRLTPSGIEQIIRRRGKAVGLDLHPHLMRHTAAHRHLMAAGSENGLMNLMGWESRTMLARYAKSAAVERALAEHQRLGLGDEY